MPPVFPIVCRFCVCALLVAALETGRAEPPGVERAWEKAGEFRFDEALEDFRAAEGREALFGRAVMLINSQPRTQEKLREAAGIFEALAAEAKDGIGALSRYFLGRVWQIHMEKPDRDKALEAYREALALHSGLPLVEMAAVSTIYMTVYDGKRAGALERLAALEPLAGELRSAEGLREFHTAMGYAYLQFAEAGDSASLLKARDHLREADRLKATRWQAEGNLWVALGEVSRALGDREAALVYYRKFADTYKRDRRNHLVRERIREMETAP